MQAPLTHRVGASIRSNAGGTPSHSQLYYLHFSNSANKAWLGAIRGTYALSKRTSTYLTLGDIGNGGQSNLLVSAGGSAGTSNPAPGGNQVGVMAGVKHVF